MIPAEPVTPGRDARTLLCLAALFTLTVGVRSLGFESVFVGDEIVFPPADAQYHLRRALVTLSRFPDFLKSDPYINFPGGASVPWPPLFDFLLGWLGRVAGGRVSDLERVAAWSGPICAGLAIVPIYLAGRRIGSRRVGLIAGLVFALLPISVVYTRIGNADHHAAVGMIGAWLLYGVIALVDAETPRRRMADFAVLLFAAQTAMLLTWHGSLLYLVPAEAALLAVAIATGRRGLLAAQAASAFGSACVVMALLAISPEPLGGPYSSIALSRLHVLAMVGVATTAGGLLVALRCGFAQSIAARLGWAGAAGLAFCCVLWALPGTREGLLPAFRFLTLGDEVGAITGEQTPLFAFGDRLRGPSATLSWGLFAYALPLAPLAGGWASRTAPARAGARAKGLVLAGWGLVFCTLAVLQRRYGNDAAPAASLLFALALVAVAERSVALCRSKRPRRRLVTAVACALVVAMYGPPLISLYAPRGFASYAAFRGDAARSREVTTSIAYTLHRFAGSVRAVTPETSGYLGLGPAPAYGIISHANLGHALQYRARRATATDPFWWYIGRENWDRSLAFLDAVSEPEALALADQLAARYVVTMPGFAADTLVARLHARDGVADGPGQSALEHFRLVTESPRGGSSIGALFGGSAGPSIPYKLFEIVPGAVIEVATEADVPVNARVTIRTPTGRTIGYRSDARAASDGVARIRVPYATGDDEGSVGKPVARAVGPYRVRVGERVHRVEISERDVRRGGVVRIGGDASITRS